MPHFFSNSPGQSYHFWRICREYKYFTFARYSPPCESSIIFATPHERPRMLTNTYRLSIRTRTRTRTRSLLLTPIRISGDQFAIIAIGGELHSQAHSPYIRHYLANLPRIYFFTFARIFATVSVRLALLHRGTRMKVIRGF